MDSTDKKHAKRLQEALLALHHSGPNGFEGLLGIVLGSVTGQSFRLAKSGSQRGRDGDSAFDGGATYFEGKRYRKSPKPTEITAKLFDLVKDDVGQVDLWILGATCEIAAQTENDTRLVCERLGIGCVLLDWNDNDLGSLLVAIANAGEVAKQFISDKLKGKPKAHLIKDAVIAIDHFANHPDLPTRLELLRAALSAEEAGLGHARERNKNWWSAMLASRVSARAALGQPLAPLDASGLAGVSRPLEAHLANAFRGKPKAEVYAVYGEEGVGKSWLTASAWLALDPRSILTWSPAEDLLTSEVTGDFESFLIGKLIQQTGGQRSDRTAERWRRRIKGWRVNPSPQNVRVTMVFDGLNQPMKADWSRRIDHAASELSKLGGCLIITTRSTHWKRLRSVLSCTVEDVFVNEWNIQELRSILEIRGIDAEKVKPDVFSSLRNPRILGIAIDLLSNDDVERIDQLSVGRLIFEHLRKAQTTGAVPMSGPEFAELLKSLANETLERAKNPRTDDLRLFDEKHHQGLEDVASCRFFQPVRGSLQYEIKQDGLNLGLALSLIGALEKETRNARDPRDRLAAMLEPITALDEAASIVFLATQIACLDEETSPDVRSALIEHFVSMQNLPNNEADAFAVLARTAAPSFLTAAEGIHTSLAHVPNAEWILYALRNQRDDAAVWTEISNAVRRWLSFYSLAPERMMFKSRGQDPDAEVSEERTKRLEAINEKVGALTNVERKYIDANLARTDRWHFETLHALAFSLLAGKPLEGFADVLVSWSFSDALGGAIYAPDNEFRQLIRFNRLDWKETQAALLERIKIFEGTNSSNVGKWATVEILRATGAIDDADKAEDLADWLTREREQFEGWSLIETYCSVDPCNPNTRKPRNIDDTAAKYSAIDPSKLANHLSHGPEDHFFDMARTGMARFRLDDAIAIHRALADDLLKRTGFSQRQAAVTLLRHSSALTHEQAWSILRLGQASGTKLDEHNQGDRDGWITAQYCIFMGIAHLPADEQLEAIAAIEGNAVLLDIFDALLPASEEATERALKQVLHLRDNDKQRSVLGAIRHSMPPLSERSRIIIGDLLNSTDAKVRTQALGAVAASGDPNLLKMVVASGWSAYPLRANERTFERWHGSSAILGAAKAGLIALESALDRMDLHHYGFAAETLGKPAAREISKRVEAALINALGYTQGADLPEISTSTPKPGNPAPPLISLNEPRSSEDAADQLNRLNETNEQFAARQDRMARSFEKFATELTAANASLILADLTPDGTEALVKADSEAGKRWIEMLNAATDMQLRHLHHVAFQLSIALAEDLNAQRLLTRIASIDPSINRVEGLGKVSTESLSLWRNAHKKELRHICKRRLITCQNDAEIALEVFTATLGGCAAVVEETIDDLLATEQPLDICLALTLAGFCDESVHASRVLARLENARGYVGVAHKAAIQAYQRNLWSRHWYEQMRSAKALPEFWQASVLFTKIVDVRFDIWAVDASAETDQFKAFLPTIERQITRRIEKWQSNRRNHLYGDKCPAKVFLTGEID